MRIGLVSTPVPAVPLSRIQRDYYFYLFASRVLSVFDHLGVDDFRRFWMLEPIHLGLLQLIAFLEEQGIECTYFGPISPPDRPVDREQALLDKVLRKAGDLDVLGFSTITASYPTAVRMAAAVRRAFPDLPLVVGGAHAWACDEQILRDSPFDVVVRKEGELTTLELLRALAAGTSLDGIAGLSFRRHGNPVRNPDRPRMDRRVLPNPAYGHLEDNLDPTDLAGERRILDSRRAGDAHHRLHEPLRLVCRLLEGRGERADAPAPRGGGRVPNRPARMQVLLSRDP